MLGEKEVYDFLDKINSIIKVQDEKINNIKEKANNGGFFEYMRGKIHRSKLEGISLALQLILEEQISNIDDVDLLDRIEAEII